MAKRKTPVEKISVDAIQPEDIAINKDSSAYTNGDFLDKSKIQRSNPTLLTGIFIER